MNRRGSFVGGNGNAWSSTGPLPDGEGPFLRLESYYNPLIGVTPSYGHTYDPVIMFMTINLPSAIRCLNAASGVRRARMGV